VGSFFFFAEAFIAAALMAFCICWFHELGDWLEWM
jgi:hypothetical protein